MSNGSNAVMASVTDNMGDDCAIEDNRSCVHSSIHWLYEIILVWSTKPKQNVLYE
jgi:hypothetical protein